jgi:transposase
MEPRWKGTDYLAGQIGILSHQVLVPSRTRFWYFQGDQSHFTSGISQQLQQPVSFFLFIPCCCDFQKCLRSLHRVRESWVGRRTSVINQIRGLLLERRVTIRKGRRFGPLPPDSFT